MNIMHVIGFLDFNGDLILTFNGKLRLVFKIVEIRVPAPFLYAREDIYFI